MAAAVMAAVHQQTQGPGCAVTHLQHVHVILLLLLLGGLFLGWRRCQGGTGRALCTGWPAAWQGLPTYNICHGPIQCSDCHVSFDVVLALIGLGIGVACLQAYVWFEFDIIFIQS